MLIGILAKIAGKKLLKASNKVLIAGCLGYLILPTDLIPDVIAGLGFTDDLAVLGVAFTSVGNLLSDAIKMKAQQNSRKWLGKKD